MFDFVINSADDIITGGKKVNDRPQDNTVCNEIGVNYNDVLDKICNDDQHHKESRSKPPGHLRISNSAVADWSGKE